MASPFATLSKTIAQQFAGKLARGKIYRAESMSVDEFGDPEISGSAVYPFEGIKASFGALYKAEAGIPDTDVQVMVLNQSTLCPLPLLQTDKVYIGPIDGSTPAQWHQVRKVLAVDPAGAHTMLQAYVINEDPTAS